MGESAIPLLAPMPLGDGPRRAHVRLRAQMSAIARRVAMKALAERKPDVFLEVYAAGMAHAVRLSDRVPVVFDEVRCPICEDRAHPCERCEAIAFQHKDAPNEP